MDRSTLQRKSVSDLKEIASQLGLSGYSSLRKAELVDVLVTATAAQDEPTGEPADDEPSQDAPSEESPAEVGRRRRADADALIERRRRRTGRDDDGDGSSNGRADAAASPDDGADRDGRGGGDRGGDDASAGRGDDGRGRERRRGRQERDDQRGRGDGDQRRDGDAEVREGVLDLLPEGYGFLRTTGYLAGELDVYVSQSYVRRFQLRRGDRLGGPVRFNKGNDRFPALARLETHEGEVVTNENDPKLRDRPTFGELDAAFPTDRLLVDAHEPAARLLDAVAPQGFGQRTLVTAPHGAGASLLLGAVAAEAEERDVHVVVVMVDARPEEVTWHRRTSTAEVVASELGGPAEDHVALVELAVERARRLAESGRDVVLLVDSLSAVGRAYAAANAGRNQSVQADPAALAQAVQLFAVGRDLDDAGSVTMVGVLVEDARTEVDRALAVELQAAATSRVQLLDRPPVDGLPVVDVRRSGTLREDLLVDEATLADMHDLRGRLAEADPEEWPAVLG